MRAILMEIGFFVACLLGITAGATGATLEVPAVYSTIQEAIDAAEPGDVVLVTPGLYVETLDLLGKAITVRSSGGSGVTTIDGDAAGTVVRFRAAEGPDCILDGFTLTNGFAVDGGGVLCDRSSPTLTNLVVTGNTASRYGGGMATYGDARPTLTGCSFEGNAATYGGGVSHSLSRPTFRDVVFTANTADIAGGGMFNADSHPKMIRCNFAGNLAPFGGGMFSAASSRPMLSLCTFAGNAATYGGGMENYDAAEPILLQCVFSGNTADLYGGGMENYQSSPSVTNCLFLGNAAERGAGMANLDASHPSLCQCTFRGNIAGGEGGGVFNRWGCEPRFVNSILVGDLPAGEIVEADASCAALATYSCIEGGAGEPWFGAGCIDADPAWVSGPRGDCYLSQVAAGQGIDSPCIDAGDPAALMVNGTTRTDEVQDSSLSDMGYHYPYDYEALQVPAMCSTIQEAIRMAFEWEIVLVAPGTYVENLDFLGKALTVRSDVDGDPATHDPSPETTLIDGSAVDRVVAFRTEEGPDSVLEGFTLLNGSATHGGGIYCLRSAPTIVDCVVTANTATYGGGMLNRESSPLVTDCIFSANTASEYGGGMHNYEGSHATVTACTFTGNSAGYGAGMMNSESHPIVADCDFSGNIAAERGGGMENFDWSAPVVVRCNFDGNSAAAGGGMDNRKHSHPIVTDSTFTANQATDPVSGAGGGMLNTVGSSPMVTGCDFVGNSAQAGGGMTNHHASPAVTRCVFEANQAAESGGGMLNVSNHATVSHCDFAGNMAVFSGGGLESIAASTTSVINCLFHGNAAPQGSAFLTDQGLSKVIHCTLSENTADAGAGAVQNLNGSYALLVNCILWNDAGGEIRNDGSSSAAVSHSCVDGGYPGTGNIDVDPLFVGPSTGDYHLSHASPCIDVGDNQAPLLPERDWDGDPRVFPGRDHEVRVLDSQGAITVDMGADEYCGVTSWRMR